MAAKLGYYVYLYVNPLNKSIFYVGKGKSGRALSHLNSHEKRAITQAIGEIRAAGEEPQIEILAHGLSDPDAAHQVEAAAIDLLGLDGLANVVRGHGAKFGRMPIQELVAHYSSRRANIREPAILIRINKLYRYGMTDIELYDATRSAWKVGPQRERVRLALAVFEGVVREVYAVSGWLPAGSTFNLRRNRRAAAERGRWEFVGTIADDRTRNRYRDRHVGHLFRQGAQNPIAYVNVE